MKQHFLDFQDRFIIVSIDKASDISDLICIQKGSIKMLFTEDLNVTDKQVN